MRTFSSLNVIPISLPPLGERREDIPFLAQYFLRRFAAETKKNFIGIEADAEATLVAHEWPGNVRELANGSSARPYSAKDPELLSTICRTHRLLGRGENL